MTGNFHQAGDKPSGGFACWDPNASRAGDPSAPFDLSPAFPNPAMDQTSVALHVDGASTIGWTVFDLAGRPIARHLPEPMAEGRHLVGWNGLRDDGRAVPSGVYYMVLKVNKVSRVLRMAFIR